MATSSLVISDPFRELSPSIRLAINPWALLIGTLWLIFSISGGYRFFGDGPDYANYLRFYDQLSRSDIVPGYRFEIGFTTFAWLFKFWLGATYSQFSSCAIALALGIKLRLLWRHTSAPVWATVVYLMIIYPLHDYTQIRAALGLAFGYWAVVTALSGRHLSALGLFGIALTFHWSTASLGMAYLASTILLRYPRFAIIGLTAITVLATALILPYLFQLGIKVNPYIQTYLLSELQNEPPKLLSGANLLFGATLIASSLSVPFRHDKASQTWLAIAFLSLVIFVTLIDIPIMAHRIKELLHPAFLFLAFRFRPTWIQVTPAILMSLNGVWSLYKFVEQEVIFT